MKSIANWNKKIAVCLALAMMISASATSISANAASANAITLSTGENTQVFVVGKTYELKVKDAVSFKSSNTAVAKVDANGKVTVLKRGTVTITATTKSGKKVSKKYYVVNKAGTTAYQTTLDKMLAADNITKIVLKNTTSAKKYVIKAGDYSDKVLYVNAAECDVRNYATFKKITLVDVASNTWNEYGKGNSFTISDEDVHFVAATCAVVKEVNLTAEKQNVKVDVRGTVENVTVTGEDTTVTVNATGDVKKVVIDNKANVVITGSAEKVAVEVTANAEGATVKSDVPVEASFAAKASLTLEKGAESSVVEKASSKVALTVENNTDETVSIAVEGSQTTETVAPSTSTGNSSTGTTGGSTGGSGNGTITTTVTVAEEVSEDGKKVEFILPTTLKNLKSATVKVTTGAKTKDYAISKTVLNKVLSLLDAEAQYVDMWNGLTGITVTSDGLEVKVNGEAGPTKTVSFDGMTFTATVNKDSKSVTIKRDGSSASYTLSKEGNTKLIITSDTNTNVEDLVDFVVTY